MKKMFIKLSITLTVFIVLVCLSQTSYSTEHVTVRQVYTNGIVVENSKGEQYLKIPEIVSTLIEVDTEYRVKHKQRIWESNPTVFGIEPRNSGGKS